MTQALDSSIQRVRGAVARAVFGSTLFSWIAGLALGLACVVLLVRAGFDWESGRAAWLFAPLLCAPLIAWRAAVKKGIGASAAAVWLDLEAGASGALVTDFEVADPAWHTRVDAALARVERLPASRSKRPALAALASFVFAGATLLVPMPQPAPNPIVALQAARVEKVEEALATLEEQITLTPEFADEMRASLERLKEEDALANQESALEAIDRANERLSDEAEAAAESAESVVAGVEAAETLAASDPDAAQRAVEEAFAKLSSSGLAKGLADELARELGLESLELPPGTVLDAATLARLSQSLEGKLGDKLAKLAARGLLKEGRFERGTGRGAAPEFEEHVCTAECAKNPGGTCNGTGRVGPALSESHRPGQAGLSRGRGDAPLTFGEEAPGDTDRFEAKALPSAQYRDPEQSTIVGVGVEAPTVAPTAEPGGQVDVAASGGRTTWKRRLAPHHRRAVQTYFTRDTARKE